MGALSSLVVAFLPADTVERLAEQGERVHVLANTLCSGPLQADQCVRS